MDSNYPVKKLIAFTAKMANDMKTFCREKNIESESELIRQAVVKYMAQDAEDKTFTLAELRNIKNGIEELKDMINIHFRFHTITFQSLLAYNPEIPEQLKEAAIESSKRRYDRVFIKFQEGIQEDAAFFERILHTYYGEKNGQG